jgi:hypothetical protein
MLVEAPSARYTEGPIPFQVAFMKARAVVERVQLLLRQVQAHPNDLRVQTESWNQVDALLGGVLEILVRSTDIQARTIGATAVDPQEILQPFRDNEHQWRRMIRMLDQAVPAPLDWSKVYRDAFRNLMGTFYAPDLMRQAFPGWRPPAVPSQG